MTIKDELGGLLELADELKQNVRYIAEDLGVDLGADGADETASPEAQVKLRFAEGVTPEELREALGYYRGLSERRSSHYHIDADGTPVRQSDGPDWSNNEHNYGVETQTKAGGGFGEFFLGRTVGEDEKPLSEYDRRIVERRGYCTAEEYLWTKFGKKPSEAGVRKMANSVLNNLPLPLDIRTANPEVLDDGKLYFTKRALDWAWNEFYEGRSEISW